MNGIQSTIERWTDVAAAYAPRLGLALVTLLVGIMLIRLALRVAERGLGRTPLEPTVRSFLISLGNIVLKVVLFVSVASTLGIATTSLVALVGAAGLAIGLALQGSLSNVASGVLILIFKPYRVGDVIESQGKIGSVHAIHLFHTELITGDNQKIILPNGRVYSDVIVNITEQPTRRVEVVVGVAYDTKIAEARQVLLAAVRDIPGVLADPEPRAEPRAFADSAIEMVVRVWCATGDFWEVFFAMHERVKDALDAAGIVIPLPQRAVRVLDGTPSAIRPRRSA